MITKIKYEKITVADVKPGDLVLPGPIVNVPEEDTDLYLANISVRLVLNKTPEEYELDKPLYRLNIVYDDQPE